MLEPGNREYLCRLAKQWSDLTYEDGATVEQIQSVNGKAMEYADRVVAMSPKVRGGCWWGQNCGESLTCVTWCVAHGYQQ
jgi:hypothetical protein